MSARRLNTLGVGISAINMPMALGTIHTWISQREQNYVTVTPAHAVMDAYRDPGLRRTFNRSGMTTPDGMAIVWLLRLQGHKDVSRVYGPDLMLEVCKQGVAKGYRHFLYGGGEGVAQRLRTTLAARIPGLETVGNLTPPFRELTEEEDRAVVEEINAARPDIVWVGLSTPKQERWMAGHLGRLEAPVLVGVGAAFDFLSGSKPQAPRWMQGSGLEWLFRLAREPRRLWPRYRQYPLFVLLVLAQLLGLKRFPESEALPDPSID
jgi:N-acetylglucosaminyldiphosphoundecaprenol N-acetyl-beta-D-mannosaminyltransferase